MRRALSVFLVGALSTCTGWEIGEPPARFAPAVSLGTQLPTEGSVLRQYSFRLGATSQRAIVMIEEARGLDLDLKPVETKTNWYSVDAAMALRPLAAPPFAVDQFWPTGVPGGLLTTTGTVVQTLDANDAWTQLPANVPVNPDFVVQTPDGRIFARGGRDAFVWNAASSTWQSLTQPLALPETLDVVLGPIDGTFARVVWMDGRTRDVCTQKVELATLSPSGARTCKYVGNATPVPRIVGDVVNGTTDDFSLVLLLALPSTDVLWHFTQDDWQRGNFIQSRSIVTSFADGDAVLSSSERGVPGQLMRVRAGRGAGTFSSVAGDLFAQCLPPTCRPTSGAFALDAHLTAMWFLSVNEADAKRTMYLKRVPVDPTPLTCTPACRATEVCVRATSSLNVCAIDESLIGGPSFVPSTVRVETINSNGLAQLATLTLTERDGGVVPISPRTEGQGQLLEVPSNTPLTLTLSLPGHASQDVAFTSANEGVLADLGQFRLGLGVRVGRQLAQLDVITSGGAAFLAVDTPSGPALQRVHTGDDGGLEVSTVTAVSALATVSGLPDSGVALVGESDRLRVIDLATGASNDVTDPSSTEPWFGATFSRDGTSAAVQRQSGFSVVSLSGTPSLRYSVRGPNQANAARLVQLSADGAVALASKIGPTLVVASSTGEVSQPDPGGLSALSGDGQFLYLTAETVPPFTLSVRSTQASGTSSLVAAQVTAWAIDPAGSDVWFTTALGPQLHRLQHYAASTATTTQLMQLSGVASALPRAGALWVGASILYPVSTATPRVVTGPMPDSIDLLGRPQGTSSQMTLVFGETTFTQLAPGPGLFRQGARRMNAGLTSDQLLGTSITSTAPFTNEPQAQLATVFTSTRPVNSLELPFGVYTQPARVVTIDPISGAVSFTVVGTDVFCLR